MSNTQTLRGLATVEIFNKLHGYVKNYNADGQAELFAENGVWEFPFAIGSIPKKIEGRENIRNFGKMGMERSKNAGRRIVQYNSVIIHQTSDVNTIIVEFELEGEITETKKRYKIPYIQKLIVTDGKIKLLSDYFSMELIKNIVE